MTGLYPKNEELYKLAFIHKSASLRLHDGMVINNERLEFLGDAILDAVVAEYLYIKFPDKKEGFLTQEEILKFFPDAEKRLDELDNLYDRLEKANVDVFDTAEEDLKEDVKSATDLEKELESLS
ncbi:MAG TPA: hypothetical protein DEQ03_10695, partial [Marinilabiliales bacterium]|nr:hypothetical protein [Marinilabiliales bacterium]